MHRAKTELSKLVDAAEQGKEVIISRDGEPAVRLVPVRHKELRLGALTGRVKVPQSDTWWQPMSDKEVDRFLSKKAR